MIIAFDLLGTDYLFLRLLINSNAAFVINNQIKQLLLINHTLNNKCG
jgi:hypothetical protein